MARSALFRMRALWLVGVACICAMVLSVQGEELGWDYANANGDVTWGGAAPGAGYSIGDAMPPNTAGGDPDHDGRLTFWWTVGDVELGTAVQHNGYAAYSDCNGDAQAVPVTFWLPPPAVHDPLVGPVKATDWVQVLTPDISKDGEGDSKVYSGNIRAGSPFEFYPIDDILTPHRIPDFAGAEEDAPTIYTAVDLNLYTASNPDGPLDGDWAKGDTLASLNLTILNGRIMGVAGIYFATCEFEFDPDSATGWVPVNPNGWLNSATYQAAHGMIHVLDQHQGAVVSAP